MQGVGNCPQPGHPPVQAVSQGESGVDYRGGHFGDQGLLGKAHRKAPEALGGLFRADPGAFQPLGELAEAGDGAGNRLGEEGEIEQHAGEAPGPGVFVPVDVDGVGHGFKGEKRNAQGSQEPRGGELRPQQAVEAPGKEVQVLESAQQEKVEGQDRGQQGLSRPDPGHEKTGSPAHGGGEQKAGYPLPLPAGIEGQTDGNKQIFPPPDRNQQAEKPSCREEEKQEGGGMECHANTNS